MDITLSEDIEVDNENEVEVTNVEDNKKKSKKKSKRSKKSVGQEENDGDEENTERKNKKKSKKKRNKELDEMIIVQDSVEEIFGSLNAMEKMRLMALISKVQARFKAKIAARKFKALQEKTTETVAKQNLIEIDETTQFQSSGASGNRDALLDLLHAVQSNDDYQDEDKLIIAKFGQTHYRRWLAKLEYKRRLEEQLRLAILLQRSQIRIKKNHKRKVEAAICIQKHRRGNLGRREAGLLRIEKQRRDAGTKIQSAYRGYQGRKFVNNLRYFNNTVKLSFLIAATWKGYSTRQMMKIVYEQLNRKKMALKIQNCYLDYKERCHLADKRKMKLWQVLELLRQKKAIIIQKWWRKIFLYYKFQWLIKKKREKDERDRKQILIKRSITLKNFKKAYEKQLQKHDLVAEEAFLLRLKAQQENELRNLSV